MFLKSEIDNWLKEGRRKTAAEIRAEAQQFVTNRKGGAMSNPRILADILKDYFQNSQEPLAVEFRNHFAGTDNPLLTEKPNDDTALKDWIDGQMVMQALHISPRTLQTLRTNGTLPFSKIGRKLYYNRSDILRILQDNYTMYKIRNHGNK